MDEKFKNTVEKFKNTVEKFQDILDYYVQMKYFLKNVDLSGVFIINFSSILLFLKNVLIQIIHMKFGNNLLEVKYNFYL